MSEGFKYENGGSSYSMFEVDIVSISFCEHLFCEQNYRTIRAELESVCAL